MRDEPLFEPACRRMEWLDPFYKQVWEKAYADGIPISGTFELTPRCNFNCRMCYVHLKPEQIPAYGQELSAKQWLDLAQQAMKAGTTWLCVTGGEPLMHPQFEEIWRGLTSMGFFITLQTNASLVTGKMADLLAQCPPRSAKVTLYGSNDQVYQKVCGVEHGFTRVEEGLNNLREMKIPTQLISTVIRQNQEDVAKMAYFAFTHRLPWMATGGIKPSIRGADSQAREVRVQEENDKALENQIRRLLEKPIDPARKPCTYCKDYRLGYWIAWNGEMRFCSFMDTPHLSAMDLGFDAAWQGLLEYWESLSWPEECAGCEAKTVCMKCPGLLAAECGDPQRVTPAFCNRIKEMYHKVKGD